MPTYRKLHTKIIDSFDFAEMPDDFTRVFWMLLIVVADSEGRAIDSPAWLRSRMFPLRSDVKDSQIETALAWLAERGMVTRYQVNGRGYFFVDKFKTYQTGTEREAKSLLPAPPEQVMSNSGAGHEQVVVAASASVSESENEGVKEQPSLDDVPDGDLAPYEQAFIDETKLPIMAGGPERWFEGLKAIKECGATVDDFRQAIREQISAAKNGRRYNLNSPASYVNATLNVVAKRQKPADNYRPAEVY